MPNRSWLRNGLTKKEKGIELCPNSANIQPNDLAQYYLLKVYRFEAI